MPPTPTSDDAAVIKAHWDDEYQAGRWDFLRGLKQQSRSGLIAAWLKLSGNVDNVLDVGCGECLLHAFLKPYGMRSYTGVDVSANALAMATVDIGDVLVEATLEGFDPGSARFSAIVFNEVLCFPKDPGAQLRRYREFLQPDGVIAISVYAPDRPDSGAHRAIANIWEATDGPGFTVIDDLTIRGGVKTSTFKLRLVARND